ncbi:hypothetical protein PR002_g11795 [Phytophthora rubi]|uniref:Secreted protein n=1 Tax=Phytophthora rubi TaxID=129364 RepID=A0A6A3LZ65_9STRA|nr:hypothetical protein PR002_g11795 [Phytophthora rubi]
MSISRGIHSPFSLTLITAVAGASRSVSCCCCCRASRCRSNSIACVVVLSCGTSNGADSGFLALTTSRWCEVIAPNCTVLATSYAILCTRACSMRRAVAR